MVSNPPPPLLPVPQVNEQFPNRTSRRVMHGSIQIVSTAFAAMGVMTVIGTHSVNGLSNVGAGHVSNAYKVHAWLGYVSVGFILVQVGACPHAFPPTHSGCRCQVVECVC